MFIDNSIATLGSSKFLQVHEKIDDRNAVYVLDNEPYKPETLRIMEQLIDAGKSICIFPEKITQKDVNDMVIAGHDVKKMIDDNTHVGLKARMVFNKWKKMNI